MKRIPVFSLFLVGMILLVAAGNLPGQVPNGADENDHVLVKGRPWETDGDGVSVPTRFQSGELTSHRLAAALDGSGENETLETAVFAPVHGSQSHPLPAWLRIYRFIISIRCFR